MSYTVSLQKRIQELKKVNADLPNLFIDVQKKATIRAIKVATDATPPKKGTGRGKHIGTNTVTGELKAHWAADSITQPKRIGDRFVTELKNNLEYASYVNDGHRMDRHFVPGLYVDPRSKLLSYDPSAKVGLVVGTKTKYVKGEFMKEKAKKAYEETVLKELDREIRKRVK